MHPTSELVLKKNKSIGLSSSVNSFVGDAGDLRAQIFTPLIWVAFGMKDFGQF